MHKFPPTVFRLIKLAVVGMIAFIAAIVLFLGYLFFARNTPLQLPAATGPFAVGRMELNWTDASRTDPLADQGSAARKLVIWIWYPAADSGTNPAPYLPPRWAQARDQDQGIGVLVESSLSKIRTGAFEDVPVAAAPRQLPVLIMEPGMGPITTDYTVFAQNLASNGYVVVGINPTYTSNWTVFQDGQIVPRSKKGSIPDNDTPEAMQQDAGRILDVWAQDVIFVMDQLEKQNADSGSPFYQRLALDRIGVWGHSFGGATAVDICERDPRCKAGVDMDGTPWAGTVNEPLPQPFMFITEDYSKNCDENCVAMREVYQHTKNGGAYFLSVSGAGHFNFSDLPFRQQPVTRPLFALAGYEGSIRPERALAITNAYLTAFFDQYIKGTPSELLQGPSPAYPEVSFEKH